MVKNIEFRKVFLNLYDEKIEYVLFLEFKYCLKIVLLLINIYI